MSAEDNKAVVRRFYEEVFNGRNLGTIDDLQTGFVRPYLWDSWRRGH